MPETRQLSYDEAVNVALAQIMATIPKALVFGEDVAKPGGPFGVTQGLYERFGEDRVFDTPISEAAILGGAVGAALVGCTPIVEIMWIDFMLVALDQIVNQAANVRYMSAGRATAPIVVRTQQGNSPGACAQHSQSLEALFLHVPGIRVVMPSTPQGAYDALLTAAHVQDPVLVIENRTLYCGPKLPVVLRDEPTPMGSAVTRREGRDATLVTWGAMTEQVLDAADALSRDGIDVEVVETPWLNPFDAAAVRTSLERTGRLVVVHEAHVTGGFGAEVVARLTGSGVELTAPPLRIATPDIRLPAAPQLAGAAIPNAEIIRTQISAYLSKVAAVAGSHS
jgi:acetoin:2,6-dichlorophenolindophenol oxidoreductase subunit beta